MELLEQLLGLQVKDVHVSVAVAVGDIADELINNISIKSQNLKISPWTNSESDMVPLNLNSI